MRRSWLGLGLMILAAGELRGQGSAEPPLAGPLLTPPGVSGPELVGPSIPPMGAAIQPAAAQSPILTAPAAPPPTVITLPEGPHARPIRYVPAPEEAPGRWNLFPRAEPREEQLGSFWSHDDLLIWWLKPGFVPPLLSRSRVSGVPSLGDPNSSLILGGKDWSNGATSGYRTSLGKTIGNGDQFGIELVYFFLGTRSVSGVVGSPWQQSGDFLARPYQDPLQPGSPEVGLPVNVPGSLRGGLAATLSSRVTGWELNTVTSLISTKPFQLEGTLGYRYFQFNEGLRVDQEGFELTPGGLPRFWRGTADQIDAHNQFHGGQLGLRGEFRGSAFFLDFNGKIALGTNYQTVRTSGLTVVAFPGDPGRVVQQGGFLVQPSNSGRISRSPFAVLPEATVRLGLHSGNRHRLFIGYNFMYLSDVVRAGDQVDRVINLSQQAPRVGLPFVGPERPLFGVQASDAWVQGLILGFETRY